MDTRQRCREANQDCKLILDRSNPMEELDTSGLSIAHYAHLLGCKDVVEALNVRVPGCMQARISTDVATYRL